MQPLLVFRNTLEDERNISENRLPYRRNGQKAVTEDGHNQGSYTIDYRVKKLSMHIMTTTEGTHKVKLLNRKFTATEAKQVINSTKVA